MATLNLGLLFLNFDPDRPIAIVQVQRSGGQEYAGQKYDDLISCECLGFRELDAEIDRLKNELEEIRNKARHRFAAAA